MTAMTRRVRSSETPVASATVRGAARSATPSTAVIAPAMRAERSAEAESMGRRLRERPTAATPFDNPVGATRIPASFRP